MNGWIQLTPAQVAALAALSASNPGNDFVTPTADASGNLWLSASVLSGASDVFAHYAEFLSGLTVTQTAAPTWPVSTD